MIRKNLLVLAASVYQIDAIVTAQRLGYRVITTDNVPSNPGHKLADRCYFTDTTNRDAVLEIARAEKIDGILAPATDVAVSTAAYVAERLSLRGPSLAAASILTEKFRFRQFLREIDLPCPRAFQVPSGPFRDRNLFDGRRWILKPNRSSGSKGIFIVASPGELEHRLRESLAFSADGTAVLEEFIEGSQHTCEGCVVDGRIAFHLITDRSTVPPPHTATSGHRVPTLLSTDRQAEMLELLARIFDRLDVTSGVFDCDFVVGNHGVTIIETTPRLGGNSLASLIRSACGFDIVEFAIHHACQQPSELPTPCAPTPSAVIILGVARAGRLKLNERQLNHLRSEPWTQRLTLDVQPGQLVMPFINGRHRVGEAVIVATSRAELDARVDELQQRLQLEVE